MKVVFTDEALANLDGILSFIASNYPSIYDAFQSRLRIGGRPHWRLAGERPGSGRPAGARRRLTSANARAEFQILQLAASASILRLERNRHDHPCAAIRRALGPGA
jgi:hypothetical protein